MTWTYSDWITQPTPGTRLTRLRLHIAEVSEVASGVAVSKDGASRDPSNAREYLATLMEREEKLDKQAQTASAGLVPVRVVDAR